jgi:hypothetical protein
MTRELLWITPKFPLPADDGARIATCNLLRGLAKLGEDIHLVAIAGAQEVCDVEQVKKELGVKKVSIIARGSTPKSRIELGVQLLKSAILNPMVPVTMRHYKDSSVVRALAHILSQRQAGIERYLVYDGLHSAIHSSKMGKFFGPTSEKVIYRAHNREASLWERSVSQSRGLKRLLLAFQAKRVRVFEQSLLSASRGVAAVSQEDLQALKSECTSLKGSVVPIGYEFVAPLDYVAEQELNILFIGKLNWPPNRDGLIWFLDKVWPTVFARRPDLRLIIAGSGQTDIANRVTMSKGIKFVGRVDKTEPLYEQSVLSLIPIFYGSGTRVKAIESCRFGRACLSTEIGVEGIGLKTNIDYYLGETEQAWIRVLTELSVNEALTIGKRAFETAKNRFELEHAAIAFRNLLDEV